MTQPTDAERKLFEDALEVANGRARRLQGEVDELRAAAVRTARSAVTVRDELLAQRSLDALSKYETLGVTVGELRTALARVPSDTMVVVRVPGDDETFVVGWITNCGVDSGSDGGEFFALDVSGREPVVHAEDLLRRGQ